MGLENVALKAGNKIYQYNPELGYHGPVWQRYWDMYKPTSNLATIRMVLAGY